MTATATATVPMQAVCPSEYGTLEQFTAHLWAYLGITERDLERFAELGIEPRQCGCECGRWVLALGGRR